MWSAPAPQAQTELSPLGPGVPIKIVQNRLTFVPGREDTQGEA